MANSVREFVIESLKGFYDRLPFKKGLTEITYSELKALRDGGNLIPGMKYRITDYECTTVQENTRSAGHQFDVIVIADSTTVLNENAWAAHHVEDTYFTNCNLDAWELKYCLDNDTNRFAWADEENGKGVIFYMKDEWNNECPYDFKNIMFKRFAITECVDCPSLEVGSIDNNAFGYYYGAIDLSGINVLNNATYGEDFGWFYTFALKDLTSEEWYDYTVVAHLGLKDDEDLKVACHDNHIIEGTDEYYSGNGELARVLNNVVFFNCYGDLSNTSYSDDYSYCNGNRFFGKCQSNTFGNYCQYNLFGNNCQLNTFGDGCKSNVFGNDYIQNTFGNECINNSFGNNCHNNSFKNNCYNNSFCNFCYNNSFGNNCCNNSFGNNYYYNTFGNYCQAITVFDDVLHCNVTGGTSSAIVKNAQILSGTKGTSNSNRLTITFESNQNKTQVACLDSNGQAVIYYANEILNKADKVQNATNGNFAGLDGNGNLTDSGYSSADFVSHSDLSNTPKIVIPSVDGKPSHMTSDEIAGLKVGDVIVSQTLTGDVNFYVTKITGDENGSIVYAVNVNEQRIVTMTFINTNGTWAYQDSSSLDIATVSNTPKIIIPSVDGTIRNMTNDEIASLKIGDIVINGNWVNYYVVKRSGNANGSEILLTYVDNTNIGVISLKKANGVWAYNRYWSIALTNINNISDKADKVQNAVSGNLAGLDSTGNLTDCGVSSANISLQSSTPKIYSYQYIDQLTSAQVVALKVGDIVLADHSNSSYGGITRAYYVTYKDDAECNIDTQFNGENYQVGYAFSENSWIYASTEKCSLTGLMEKPDGVTGGHLALFTLDGSLTDSGKSVSDFATAAQGAKADTAYQKPSTGIPASDLANGVIPQSEVFWAEYETTTAAEIIAAVTAGKVVMCNYGNHLYRLEDYRDNQPLYFSCFISSQIRYYLNINRTTNIWSGGTITHENAGINKVSTITGNETNTSLYPNTKAVADYVANKADKTSVVTLTGTSVTQEMTDNTIYQCSVLSSLTITIPNGVTPDYISQINFISGNFSTAATTLTAPNTIVWYGDDITNGVFVPVAQKRYIVMFYSDGVDVRGVVQCLMPGGASN